MKPHKKLYRLINYKNKDLTISHQLADYYTINQTYHLPPKQQADYLLM